MRGLQGIGYGEESRMCLFRAYHSRNKRALCLVLGTFIWQTHNDKKGKCRVAGSEAGGAPAGRLATGAARLPATLGQQLLIKVYL